MQFRLIALTVVISGSILSSGEFNFVAAQTVFESPLAPKPRQTLDPVLAQPIADPPMNLPAITRQQRQQAYAKLLEGQRYLWTMQNLRSQNEGGTSLRLAKQALAKAVEINPGLAEGYTALAEITSLGGGSVAEIERLANFGIRFNRNNVGSHKLLARIYTRQSNLGNGNLEKSAAEKAINEWREIARLDPRNAEAWAFLSELYEQTGQTEKQLEALEKWRGASAPSEERFYRSITGRSSLAPEAASIALGRTLLRTGKTAEAIAVLSHAVVDNPEEEAFSALQEAIENAAPNDAAGAIAVLQQIALANPGNPVFLELLTNAQIRAGRIEEAVQVLRSVSERLLASDKTAAASVFAKLGSLFAEAGRETEAIAAYENALRAMNIGNLPLTNEAEREFAARVVPQLVAVYRNSGQTVKAREAIARLGSLLGTSDPTADWQLIELLRTSGEREAALQAVREARKRFATEANLLRLEAEILTEMNRVDEAVSLLRSKIINKSKQVGVPSALRDDFLLHIAISNLYMQARRSEESVAAARQALDLAQTAQMTNIALLTLATAENSAGNFKAAENTLREVLKQEPNNTTALNNLGYFLVERGERLPEAINLIKRAVERDPNNSSFLDSLGWAHFKLGQLPEAEKYLLQAAKRNPQSAAIQQHLGDLYERQGRTQEAKVAWRKALNFAREPAEIEKLRAKLGESKKRKTN